MKFLIFLLSLLLVSESALSTDKPPRQKIEIFQSENSKENLKIGISDIEKNFKTSKVTIFDPYNNNEKTEFTVVEFGELLKKYSKTGLKSVYVSAIDGYSVDIKAVDIEKEKMLLAFKDQKGYLGIDRMGPIRIIYPIQKIIDKDTLLKIGVNWVWQVNVFKFKY